MRSSLIAAVAACCILLPAASAAQDQATACVAEAVYYEARGTGEAARAAVAHVVLNRVDHGEFPDTPCDVIDDGCQFSYRCDGRAQRMANAADRAAAFETAARVLAGERPDPTAGAIFFHAAGISSAWHRTRPRIGRIGGNIFYR